MSYKISLSMLGICGITLAAAIACNQVQAAQVPELLAQITVPAKYDDGTPLVPVNYLLYVDGVKVAESTLPEIKLDTAATTKYAGKKIFLGVRVVGSNTSVSDMSNLVAVDLRSIPIIKLRIKVTGLATSTEVILE